MRKLVAETDYVIHAAALADVAACTREPADAIDVNIAGTQAVLDAVAASHRVRRMVFVSSASVYGDGEPEETESRDLLAMRQLLESVHGRIPRQFHEFDSMRPVSVYGATKAWGEQQTAIVLGQVGISYSIVRYFSLYGEPQTVKPNSHSWVVAWFAARASLGLPLHLNGGGGQVRDLTHVEDIAEGTLRALVSPGPTTRRSTSAPASPPASGTSRSWSGPTTRTPNSWRRPCRPVTRSAATPRSAAWRTSWAGRRRCRSRTGGAIRAVAADHATGSTGLAVTDNTPLRKPSSGPPVPPGAGYRPASRARNPPSPPATTNSPKAGSS